MLSLTRIWEDGADQDGSRIVVKLDLKNPLLSAKSAFKTGINNSQHKKTMNKTIEQAITNLRANSARYAKAERYYNGDHDLKFAAEKFQNTFGTLFREFALNL